MTYRRSCWYQWSSYPLFHRDLDQTSPNLSWKKIFWVERITLETAWYNIYLWYWDLLQQLSMLLLFHCQIWIWPKAEDFHILNCLEKSEGVTTQMKALNEFFLMVAFTLFVNRVHVFTNFMWTEKHDIEKVKHTCTAHITWVNPFRTFFVILVGTGRVCDIFPEASEHLRGDSRAKVSGLYKL